jgi:hypothetical protein
MPSSRMLRCVAFVRTDVSEDRIASIIDVARIGELGTSSGVTMKRITLQRNTIVFSSIVVQYYFAASFG